jgi:hypothetical protein
MPSIEFTDAPHSGLPMASTESFMPNQNFNQENFHSNAVNFMDGSQDPHFMSKNEYLHPQHNYTSQHGNRDYAPEDPPMENPYFMPNSNNNDIPRQNGQTTDAFTPRENEHYGGQNMEQNQFQEQKKLIYGQPNATPRKGDFFNQNQGPPHNHNQNQNQNPRSHQSQGPAFKDKSGAEVFPPRLKDVTNPGSTFKKKQMASSDHVRPQGNHHREMAKMAQMDLHSDPQMHNPNQHNLNQHQGEPMRRIGDNGPMSGNDVHQSSSIRNPMHEASHMFENSLMVDNPHAQNQNSHAGSSNLKSKIKEAFNMGVAYQKNIFLKQKLNPGHALPNNDENIKA